MIVLFSRNYGRGLQDNINDNFVPAGLVTFSAEAEDKTTDLYAQEFRLQNSILLPIILRRKNPTTTRETLSFLDFARHLRH